MDTSAAPSGCYAPAVTDEFGRPSQSSTSLTARCGEASELLIISMGRDGSPLERGGSSFSAHVTAVVAGGSESDEYGQLTLDDTGLPAVVRDLRNGRYIVRYTPSSVGPHRLSVRLRGEHICGSPFAVAVTARELPPSLREDDLGDGSDGSWVVSDCKVLDSNRVYQVLCFSSQYEHSNFTHIESDMLLTF
eukprot:SAG31_NODE_1555_length_7895_cov_46.107748_3_plen_191_part_00